MRTMYAWLSVLGALLPLSQLAPWLVEHGFAVTLFVRQAAGNRIAAFAWLDVLVAAITLIVFIAIEGRRLGMTRLWVPVMAVCVVGVSLGLPLFLFLRESHLARASG